MLFNSPAYLAFLPVSLGVYWVLPPRLRVAWLLAASYIFYASWSAPYLALIVGLTVANFAAGVAQDRRRSKWILIGAIALDLGALGVFKYLGFFEVLVVRAAHAFGLDPSMPVVSLVLPLGLSFFTFEFIHYQVDVFRGSAPIRDFARFALFAAFFPTQIAGPIKRYQDFDGQIVRRPRFDAALAFQGCELIALGIVKKVVLADGLAPIAQLVFDDPSRVGGVDAWAGLLAFSFQIYLDFSGYTDIGRGSAQLFGIVVPENFRAPYLATSIREFWRRWHISLSSWLRDYLYIPLGGGRVRARSVARNLFITMALGGLWHGAAGHFVVWGAGHGLLLIAGRWIRMPTTYIPLAVLIGWLTTQAAVITLWAFFRASSTSDALALLAHLALPTGPLLLSARDVVQVAVFAAVVLGAEFAWTRVRERPPLLAARKSAVLRPMYTAALIVTAVVFAAETSVRFLYFQF